ncbi:YueI family protein [Bacillus sp. V3B]|uniref:YueI family protein n=1 Tax=Bacillus sp. V3B TaxID=2804915 RepID=UPI00210F0AF9|nr:YueI family protein [Bacillus sp. V3B]MCQ6277033.1 YueI family protein [Bacillus sp. V3B]
MSKSKVDDYLQQGIHGPKVTNPDERRKFLGTLRERIEVALTQGQVMEKETYLEIEEKMKEYPQTQLFLNGHIDYRYLSKYIKKANQYKIEYTIVTNKEYNTKVGLILAHSDAVDRENIYVTKVPKAPEQKEESKGLFSFLKKLIP